LRDPHELGNEKVFGLEGVDKAQVKLHVSQTIRWMPCFEASQSAQAGDLRGPAGTIRALHDDQFAGESGLGE
jgi:hypothetical protein